MNLGLLALILSRVLVIGDSHTVGTFGQTLHHQLIQNQIGIVDTYASCGSIISWWYTGQSTTCGYWDADSAGNSTTATRHSTPLIRSLIQAKAPTTIIVALGSNYAHGYSAAQTRAELQKLIADIRASGAHCFWVGPPDMRLFRSQLPALVERIQNEVSSTCTYIDSREVTQYSSQGGDGIHYNSPELKIQAENWAKTVIDRIQAEHLLSKQSLQKEQ